LKRSTLVISILLGIVFLSMVVMILVIALRPAGRTSTIGHGNVISFVPLSGSIAEGSAGSLLSGGGASINPTFVRHRIEDAEDDPNVKAIIFKVDSPGGVVGASQEMAYLVRDSKKPVIIFAGDMVASGAYYMASQADKIVAKPGSLVGSIGVISMVPDLSGLYNKLGIKMQTIKSGKNKDMFERTLSPEERQKFQTMSDELYRQFIDDVATGRNLDRKKVANLATGEIFAGTKAKKLGLIDEVGGYQTAIDVAAKVAHIEDPVVDEYQPPTIFESLFGSQSESASIFNLVRMQIMGRDLVLLDYVRNMLGVPQYRYYGG